MQLEADLGYFPAKPASEIWDRDFLQTYDLFFRTVSVKVADTSRSSWGRRGSCISGRQQVQPITGRSSNCSRPVPLAKGHTSQFMIRDNDKRYGSSFERAASGIDLLETPYRPPKANAVCERFLGSLRRECLDHILTLDEQHVHRLVKEYKAYFNRARPHQGIDRCIPCRMEQREERPVNTRLSSQPVLNGLQHDYSWLAPKGGGHGQTQCSTYH